MHKDVSQHFQICNSLANNNFSYCFLVTIFYSSLFKRVGCSLSTFFNTNIQYSFRSRPGGYAPWYRSMCALHRELRLPGVISLHSLPPDLQPTALALNRTASCEAFSAGCCAQQILSIRLLRHCRVYVVLLFEQERFGGGFVGSSTASSAFL